MMNGKIAIVTGGTNGIGKATVAGLVQAGFQIVTVGRDAKKGAEIVREFGSTVTFLQADLSNQADIRRLSEVIHKTVPQIDVLVNNAGGVSGQREVTAEGIESTLALNLLAPFLLTNLLLDLIPQGGRIVNVSSMVHSWAKLDFGNLQLTDGYSSMRAYANAKFMLNLATFALARRLEPQGITANALHPGVVATRQPSGLMQRVFSLISSTPAQGAATSLYLATSPAVEGKTGGYYVKSKLAKPKKGSFDTALQEEVWAVCEELTHSSTN
ncbi:MAG: SDR family NAD(P)-dependent oxidoreductase [Anaerolineae bacterium]|nr:SDR family NAD(P)-dependent oxidoreductase [Anaerolineae bacterium]